MAIPAGRCPYRGDSLLPPSHPRFVSFSSCFGGGFSVFCGNLSRDVNVQLPVFPIPC